MLATFPVSKEFSQQFIIFGGWKGKNINLLDSESEWRGVKKGKCLSVTFYFALSLNPDGCGAIAIIDLKMKYLPLSAGRVT